MPEYFICSYCGRESRFVDGVMLRDAILDVYRTRVRSGHRGEAVVGSHALPRNDFRILATNLMVYPGIRVWTPPPAETHAAERLVPRGMV